MSAHAARYSFSTSQEPAWHYHQFLDAPLTHPAVPRGEAGPGGRADRLAEAVRDGALHLQEAGDLMRFRLMTDYLLIQALNGLVIGIIYAVIAAGLTVIFSILKIVNFAHGEVYMMGGYFAYFAIALAGIPPLPAVLVAMALSFVLSIVVERTLLTPLYSPTTERKGDYGILVTFGISIFLRDTGADHLRARIRCARRRSGRACSGGRPDHGLGPRVRRRRRHRMLIGLVLVHEPHALGRGARTRSASRVNPRRSSASTTSASTCWRSVSAARWPAAPAHWWGRSTRCRRHGIAARHAGIRHRHPRRHGFGRRLRSSPD